MDTPRKAPQQQRSRLTVERILEVAAQLFEEDGLETTTNDVALAAGCSIGTLYQYFPNKRALLYALALEHVRSVSTMLEVTFARLTDTDTSWEKTVRSISAAVVEAHADRPALHALMYEQTPRESDAGALLAEFREQTVCALEMQLRRCGQGGAVPRRTAEMMYHAAEAQLHHVLLDADDAAEQLTRVLLAIAESAATGGNRGV